MANITDKHRGNLDGLEAGQRDRAKCNTYADVAWMRKVTHDNLWNAADSYTRAYAAAYDHAMSGAA